MTDRHIHSCYYQSASHLRIERKGMHCNLVLLMGWLDPHESCDQPLLHVLSVVVVELKWCDLARVGSDDTYCQELTD